MPVDRAHTSLSNWRTSIDARLVSRLFRRPGLIGMGLARRITDGAESMTNRLPLLARFNHVRRDLRGASGAIVHARWAERPPYAMDAVVAPTASVPPAVVPASRVRREPPHTPIVMSERPDPSYESRRVDALPATATQVAITADDSPSQLRDVDPGPIRRSRMGAPMSRGAVTQPSLARRPATTADDRRTQLSAPIPSRAPTRERQSPSAHVNEVTHAVVAGDRADVQIRHERFPSQVAAIASAPRETPAADSLPRATLVHARSPVRRVASAIDERHEGAVVEPRRARPSPSVRASELTHAAVARDRVDEQPSHDRDRKATIVSRAEGTRSAPSVGAPSPPLPSPPALATPAPSLPAIDVHDLAEKVQRVFDRRNAHERARRGLR